jgi:hypothetical protein
VLLSVGEGEPLSEALQPSLERETVSDDRALYVSEREAFSGVGDLEAVPGGGDKVSDAVNCDDIDELGRMDSEYVRSCVGVTEGEGDVSFDHVTEFVGKADSVGGGVSESVALVC